MNYNFVEKFKWLMNQVRVLPNKIGIEMTETALIENMDGNTVN